MPLLGNVSGWTSRGGPATLQLATDLSEAEMESVHYVGMHIDPANLIGESNEGNNSVSDSITIHSPYAYADDSGNPQDKHLDFGDVVDDGAGNSLVRKTITLTNRSENPAYVYQNGISFSDGTHFRVESIFSNKESRRIDLSTSLRSLDGNGEETWVITVLFDPREATGTLNDAFTLSTYYHGHITFTPAGEATPQAGLAVTDYSGDADDLSIRFADTAFGGGSATQTFTMTNPGSGNLTILQPGLALPGGSAFTIQSIVSSVHGTIDLSSGNRSLAARDTEAWTVTVNFTPTESANYQTPLTISHLDPNDPAAVTETTIVSLQGFGRTAGDIEFADAGIESSRAIAFGDVHADGPGAEAEVVALAFSNPGELPLAVNANGLTLQTGTHYAIQSVTSDVEGPINLAGGPVVMRALGQETWTVVLTFDPNAAGTIPDLLSIHSDSATNPIVDVVLSGVGLDEPELRTAIGSVVIGSSLAFADTLADGAGGRKDTKQLILTNPGTQPLTVSQNGIDLTGGTAVLADHGPKSRDGRDQVLRLERFGKHVA